MTADGHALLAALQRAGDHVEAHPLDYMDWTRRQRDYAALVHRERYALFRAGNQVGKTIIGAALTIWACLGWHPDGAITQPPIEAWVVCTSWSQAVAVMKKVWELVPKDQVKPVRFRPKDGFGKDNPCLEFLNGSIIRFKTTGQGAEALASATIHWVWIDEPTDEPIYRELQKRVRQRAGRIIITLTPINRPVEWLAALVERGAVAEVHARLDADSLTFVGSGERMVLDNGRPKDDEWIAEEIAKTPPRDAPIVIHGEWESSYEGVLFKCFDERLHVRRVTMRPDHGEIRWVLGFDYAAADRQFGQTAALSQVQQFTDASGRRRELIYLVDLVALSGVSTSESFARAVLTMLRNNDVAWNELSAIYGDNPVGSRFVEKSNLLTQREIARQLGVNKDAIQRIRNAKDGPASAHAVRHGYGYFYEGFVGDGGQPRIVIDPRCDLMVKAMKSFDGTAKHPLKDVFDAWRYSLKDYIFARPLRPRTILRIAT